MSNDKVRAEFESWASTHFFLQEEDTSIYSDEYISCDMQMAWEAWQASRAALVVDLPETDLTGALGMAHKAVTKRCRAAIESAGVRVKP